MKRTSLAVVLAAPLLLVCPTTSPAHPPCQCSYGTGSCGICLNMFSWMHQHGPLFNYGPYYGYPPFEPYGPWNAYLQYNPWYWGNPYGEGGGGGKEFGHGGLKGGKCSGCGLFEGWHCSWLHGGWFHGSHCWGCGHGGWLKGLKGCKSCGSGVTVSGGCASCKQAAFNPQTTDPVTRLAGAGNPADSAVFYAGLPALDPNAVSPAGGLAK